MAVFLAHRRKLPKWYHYTDNVFYVKKERGGEGNRTLAILLLR